MKSDSLTDGDEASNLKQLIDKADEKLLQEFGGELL